MNIAEQLNGVAGKVRQNVHAYRQTALETARNRVHMAAKAMAAARTPVDTLVSATQRLNDVTHDAFAQLLRQNGAALDTLIGVGAERLKGLAQAEDFKSFIRKQAALNPATRARLTLELEQLWSLVNRTGREFGMLASETYAELIHGVSTRAKPAARRKTARRSARKTTRTKRAH